MKDVRDRAGFQGGYSGVHEPSASGHSSDYPELYSGLVRLHVLHHACHAAVFGLQIIEELARHGYKMSPGSMYPLLHGLEGKGLLRSRSEKRRGSIRRVYRATPAGNRALITAKERVKELFGELFEKERKQSPTIRRRARSSR